MISDIRTIVNHLQNVMGLEGKIGVYGRSLGGIPTSGICDYVDMVIIDRSFSDLEIVAERRFYSKFARALYKIGNHDQPVHSARNLVNGGINNKCYKLITCDIRDEMFDA